MPESGPRREPRWLLLAVLLFVAAAAVALGFYWPQPPAEPEPKASAMGWRPIFSQSGYGTTQTETFDIGTGQWRIKWSATLDGEGAPVQRDSPATQLRIAVHSGVSGRFLAEALDHQGVGSGVAYVAEEPRMFFLAIDSAGLQWTLQVEEGLLGKREHSH